MQFTEDESLISVLNDAEYDYAADKGVYGYMSKKEIIMNGCEMLSPATNLSKDDNSASFILTRLDEGKGTSFHYELAEVVRLTLKRNLLRGFMPDLTIAESNTNSVVFIRNILDEIMDTEWVSFSSVIKTLALLRVNNEIVISIQNMVSALISNYHQWTYSDEDGFCVRKLFSAGTGKDIYFKGCVLHFFFSKEQDRFMEDPRVINPYIIKSLVPISKAVKDQKLEVDVRSFCNGLMRYKPVVDWKEDYLGFRQWACGTSLVFERPWIRTGYFSYLPDGSTRQVTFEESTPKKFRGYKAKEYAKSERQQYKSPNSYSGARVAEASKQFVTMMMNKDFAELHAYPESDSENEGLELGFDEAHF